MTQKSRIFVHGLKAHADEMWACGLLIASNPDVIFTEIIRDAKRVCEAEDTDFVLDCGMKCDGEHYFDHHQFESTDDVDCALTLVAKRFAPWTLADTKFGPIIERIRVQDNFGIPAAEKKFGKSSSWLATEFVMISLFENEPLKIAGILAEGFRNRLAEINEIERAGKWLESNSHTEISGNGIKIMVVERSPFKEGFSIVGFNAASSVYSASAGAGIVYGWNTDGSDSRTLFRTSAGKGTDFTNSAPERPVFCHSGGFLLIFEPTYDEEYRDLVMQACGFGKKKKNTHEIFGKTVKATL